MLRDACMNHLLCHCLSKTDYKLFYTFGNNCSTEKTQCLLSSDIWIPNLANVWFHKLKYLYPLHGRLFDLHPCPPPSPRIFHSRGFWWPPSPQEFPEFLNGDFAYLPWVPEVFLACGGNLRCWPKADTSSARVSLTILWKFKVVLVLKNKESEY